MPRFTSLTVPAAGARRVAGDRDRQRVVAVLAQDAVGQHEGVLRADVVDVLAHVPAVDEDLHAVGLRRRSSVEGQADRGVDVRPGRRGRTSCGTRHVPGVGLGVGSDDRRPARVRVARQVPAGALAVQAARVDEPRTGSVMSSPPWLPWIFQVIGGGRAGERGGGQAAGVLVRVVGAAVLLVPHRPDQHRERVRPAVCRPAGTSKVAVGRPGLRSSPGPRSGSASGCAEGLPSSQASSRPTVPAGYARRDAASAVAGVVCRGTRRRRSGSRSRRRTAPAGRRARRCVLFEVVLSRAARSSRRSRAAPPAISALYRQPVSAGSVTVAGRPVRAAARLPDGGRRWRTGAPFQVTRRRPRAPTPPGRRRPVVSPVRSTRVAVDRGGAHQRGPRTSTGPAAVSCAPQRRRRRRRRRAAAAAACAPPLILHLGEAVDRRSSIRRSPFAASQVLVIARPSAPSPSALGRRSAARSRPSRPLRPVNTRDVGPAAPAWVISSRGRVDQVLGVAARSRRRSAFMSSPVELDRPCCGTV